MAKRTLRESEQLIAKFESMPGSQHVIKALDRVFIYIQPREIEGLVELIRLKAWERSRVKCNDSTPFEDFSI
jgi:hypothetical protein